MEMVLKVRVYYTNQSGWIAPDLGGSCEVVGHDPRMLDPFPAGVGAVIFDRYEGNVSFEGAQVKGNSEPFNLDIYELRPDGTWNFVRHEKKQKTTWVHETQNPVTELASQL